jgi:ankyrin repeat protein
MRALAALGADPNARTEGGDVCVHWAAQGCQLATLSALRELHAELGAQNDVGWNAVTWASSNSDGFVAATRHLASLGMDVGAVCSLNSTGNLPALPEPDRLTRMSPLMWMVPSAFLPGIRALVTEHKLDVNAANGRDLTAFMFAAAAGKHAVLDELAFLGAHVDARMAHKNQTAALWAARHGRTETLDKLAELGADLELTDADGCTCAALLATLESRQSVRRHSVTSEREEEAGDEGAAAAGPRLSPVPGSLGDPARTDVRAATFMWRLESWLCL